MRVRGAGVGAVTAATAVLAHGCAGGHWPASAEWVLLLGVCAGLGMLAASAKVFSRRTALLAMLAIGQLACHAVLSLSTLEHHHGMAAAPMLALHTAAIGVCGVLIPAAERAVRRAVAWTVRAVAILVRRPAPISPPDARVPIVWLAAWSAVSVEEGSLSKRGPPWLWPQLR